MKKELWEEELWFKSLLLNSALDPVIVHDQDGRIFFVNEAASKATGYTREELLKLNMKDISVQFGQEELRKRRSELIETAGKAVFESDLVRKGGTTIPIEVHATSVVYKGQKAVASVARDITERKKAEEELKESESRFRSLAQSATDAVIVCKHGETIVFWNRAAEEIFGYSSEEIVGAPVEKIIPERFREAHRSKVESVLSAGRLELTRRVYEAVALKKDGTEFPIELSYGYWLMKGEIYFAAIARDITDRKRAEEALKQKDLAIRRAYVDVFYAVTGGRFIIMTPEEIAAALGKPISGTERISSYEELADARKKLKEIVLGSFAPFEGLDGLLVAASEALTNAIKHAGGGTYRVYIKDGSVQIQVIDKGPGIDFSVLPKATLLAGYSTTATLGMGFSIMLELCDRVLLSTQPGSTTLVLEMGPGRLPSRAVL